VQDFTLVVSADVCHHLVFSRFFSTCEFAILRHVCRRWKQLIPARVEMIPGFRVFTTSELASKGFLALWKWAVERAKYKHDPHESMSAAARHAHLDAVAYMHNTWLSSYKGSPKVQLMLYDRLMDSAIESDNVPMYRWALAHLPAECKIDKGGACVRDPVRRRNFFGEAVSAASFTIMRYLLEAACKCRLHQNQYYYAALGRIGLVL
jgi:hypothetical protein